MPADLLRRAAGTLPGCSVSSSEAAANGPQVGERGLEERSAQILSARGAAGARLVADGPLDHLHVPVPPLLKALVEVNQALRDLGGFSVFTVDGHEDLLGGRRGFLLRNRKADIGKVAQEGVEDCLAALI